jgi:hypothetical protein
MNKGIITKRKIDKNRILYDVKISEDKIYINAEGFPDEELLLLEDEVNLIWKGDLLFVSRFDRTKKIEFNDFSSVKLKSS